MRRLPPALPPCYQDLSPEEFLRLGDRQRASLGRLEIRPPCLGRPGWGSIRVRRGALARHWLRLLARNPSSS